MSSKTYWFSNGSEGIFWFGLILLDDLSCIFAEGEVLLRFIQEDPSDHVSSEEVLKALGIDGQPPAEEKGCCCR